MYARINYLRYLTNNIHIAYMQWCDYSNFITTHVCIVYYMYCNNFIYLFIYLLRLYSTSAEGLQNTRSNSLLKTIMWHFVDGCCPSIFHHPLTQYACTVVSLTGRSTLYNVLLKLNQHEVYFWTFINNKSISGKCRKAAVGESPSNLCMEIIST